VSPPFDVNHGRAAPRDGEERYQNLVWLELEEKSDKFVLIMILNLIDPKIFGFEYVYIN
jgi:hypothetical protein